MIKEYNIDFAKTKIICHGARATRIGERLLHKAWKYLKDTTFVKGNISMSEREQMFSSITLNSLINYPDDPQKLDTGSDIFFQILFADDKIAIKEAESISERLNTPSISFVIGATEKTKITSMPYIALSCDEIALQSDISLLSLFLDLFSIYTFPQEYGADFEELRPLFNHKGRIYVVEEPTCTNLPSNQVSYNLTIGNGEELFEPTIEPSSKATFILASRKPNKDEKIKKRSYCF